MSAQSGRRDPGETSTRPYLLRAIYQWAIDNGLTPQVLVDATADGVDVPASAVSDGRVVLNLHPGAVRELDMGDDYLLFSTRFAGRPHDVQVPVGAVLAVYGRENQRGIAFPADDDTPHSPERNALPPISGKGKTSKFGKPGQPATKTPPRKSPPSHLKLVK